MKHITRRNFIHAGCAVTIATLIPHPADAAKNGIFVQSGVNNNRTVINVQGGPIWLNFCKNWAWSVINVVSGPDPTNSTSDGYPIGPTLLVAWGCQAATPAGYYGNIASVWTGLAAMQMLQQSILVSSCPPNTVSGLGSATSGATSGNPAFFGTSPTIVFQFGWNIQSVSQGASNGLGGNLIRIGVPTGQFNEGGFTGLLVNITGATGVPNGVYTATLIDAQTFDLQGTTWTSNGGVAGTAVYTSNNIAMQLPTSVNAFGTAGGGNQMSNLIWCRQADLIAIQGGAITDTVLINQFKFAFNNATRGNPGWLRFMDLSAVQGSYDADFAQRIPVTSISFISGRFLKAYYASAGITNTGASGGFTDLFTCASPPNSPTSGAYIDGEIIQGPFSATNSGGNPGINVNGRGAKPIISKGSPVPLNMNWSATPSSGGVSMQWTFSAVGNPSWLNSGSPYVMTYTSSAGATFNAVSLGTNQIVVSGLSGTLGIGQVLRGAQFAIVITSIGSTGGGNGTYTVNNVSNLNPSSPTAMLVSADVGQLGDFIDNVSLCINGNAILNTASIQSADSLFGSGNLAVYPPTGQAGRVSIAYTSGPAIYNGTNTLPSSFILATAPNANGTLIYSWLADAFLYDSNGLGQSTPYEAFVEMCNSTNAHCWYCWPVTRGSNVTAVSNFFANNLNAGLKLGVEVGNELWNPNLGCFNQYLLQGSCLGWSTTASGQAVLSSAGLRTIQYNALGKAAWVSAGRSASDYYVLSMATTADFAINSSTEVYQWAGADLTASTNTFYANYGQLNGTGTAIPIGASGYNMEGNRPIDVSTAIGCAPYWASPWWQYLASEIYGTVAVNAPWLQAQIDFANGNTASAFASLVNQFNGTTSRSSGGDVGLVLGTANHSEYYFTVFTGFETVAHSYDAFRLGNSLLPLIIMHYEGGPQWATGSQSVLGLNNINVLDQLALAYQIGVGGTITNVGTYGPLNFDLSTYTQTGKPTVTSGTYNNSTGVVVLNLASAVKYAANATFIATITDSSGTGGTGIQLNVSSVFVGQMGFGQYVLGTSVTANSRVQQQSSNLLGGPGKYFVDQNSTISSPETMTLNDTVIVFGLTGTGAVSSLNGTFAANFSNNNQTLTFTAASGLGAITITGGTINDITAAAWEVATNTQTMSLAWKNDVSYKTFIETSYYQMLQTISNTNIIREFHPGQFGWFGNQWGIYPGDFHNTTPYKNYDALHEWNA